MPKQLTLIVQRRTKEPQPDETADMDVSVSQTTMLKQKEPAEPEQYGDLQTGQRIAVEGKLSIGRKSGDLVVPYETISGSHCVIQSTEDGFELVDNSSNGSSIDDVHFKGQSRPLADGQKIYLPHTERAGVVFRVEITEG